MIKTHSFGTQSEEWVSKIYKSKQFEDVSRVARAAQRVETHERPLGGLLRKIIASDLYSIRNNTRTTATDLA